MIAYKFWKYARYLPNDSLVIQVGAHCGGLCINEHDAWSPHNIDPVYVPLLAMEFPAVLIEPQLVEYNRLVEFYKRHASDDHFNRIVFIPAALTSSDGYTDFYLNEHTTLWASLGTDRGDLREQSIKTTVPSLCLKTVIDRAPKFSSFGWLQVDIEGYEKVVIDQLTDSAFLPKILTFEYRHCPKQEIDSINNILAVLKYIKICEDHWDAMYVSSDFMKEVNELKPTGLYSARQP